MCFHARVKRWIIERDIGVILCRLEIGDKWLPVATNFARHECNKKVDKFTALFFYIGNGGARTCAARCLAQKHGHQARCL